MFLFFRRYTDIRTYVHTYCTHINIHTYCACIHVFVRVHAYVCVYLLVRVYDDVDGKAINVNNKKDSNKINNHNVDMDNSENNDCY